MSHEEKVTRRLELEFEELDDEKQDVMEVEEIKKKWDSVMKPFLSGQDSSLTSAHLKAGRKILAGLKRLVQSKKQLQAAEQNNVEGNSESNNPPLKRAMT